MEDTSKLDEYLSKRFGGDVSISFRKIIKESSLFDIKNYVSTHRLIVIYNKEVCIEIINRLNHHLNSDIISKEEKGICESLLQEILVLHSTKEDIRDVILNGDGMTKQLRKSLFKMFGPELVLKSIDQASLPKDNFNLPSNNWSLDDLEKAAIINKLYKYNGNMTKCYEELKISYRSLASKVRNDPELYRLARVLRGDVYDLFPVKQQ